MFRRISTVILPVPMPSSTMTRKPLKSMGRNNAELKNRELGKREALTDNDFNDSKKNNP